MEEIKMDAILSNYHYLEDQKIIKFKSLQSIFFGGCRDDDDYLKELILHLSETMADLPNYSGLLNHESSSSMLLELRDFLLLTNALMDDTKLEYASRYSRNSIRQFQMDMSYDQLNISLIPDVFLFPNRKYSKYFKDDCYSFFFLLKQLPESYYYVFTEEYSRLCSYIDSLDCVKVWDLTNDWRKNAVDFRNEFIGKLLYASILYLVENKQISLMDESFDSELSHLTLNDTIFQYATFFDGKNKEIYDKTLELFPLAFGKQMNDLYYSSILSLTVPKLFFWYRLDYLRYVKSIRSNKKEFYRYMDFYLRGVLDGESDNRFEDSFELFDWKNDDLNKQSHYLKEIVSTYRDSILDSTLKMGVYYQCFISSNKERQNMLEQFKRYVNLYSLFCITYHISIRTFHNAIASNARYQAPFLKEIHSYVETHYQELENQQIKEEFKEKVVSFLSFMIPKEYKEDCLELIRKQIIEVIFALYSISQLDSKTIYVMELYFMERELMGDIDE